MGVRAFSALPKFAVSEKLDLAPKVLQLRVSPPGIEWKTGQNPKMEKIGRKIENGPRPEMGKNGPKNGIWGHFSIFRHFGAILDSQFCRTFGVLHAHSCIDLRPDGKGSRPKLADQRWPRVVTGSGL